MKLYVRRGTRPGTDYEVSDDDKIIRYYVNANDPEDRSVLFFCEEQGEEIGFLNVETYEFDSVIRMGLNGRMHDTIWIRRSGNMLSIDCIGWTIEGRPWEGDYCIYAGIKPIIKRQKEIDTTGTASAIEIADTQDERLAVMLVIAIEEACKNRQEKMLEACL